MTSETYYHKLPFVLLRGMDTPSAIHPFIENIPEIPWSVATARRNRKQGRITDSMSMTRRIGGQQMNNFSRTLEREVGEGVK